MAGFGRGSRPGRRPSSSSSPSPFFSTVTMVVFVAFCLLAVWMLSSSSFVSSSSSRATMDPAIRSRASLSSSRSKPSPSLFFKEPDEAGDSDGGGGGVREVVEEVEPEVAEGGVGERAADEKRAAHVVFERVDVGGGEGDSGGEGREEEANSESQTGGGVAGVEENQQQVEEEQQQQEEVDLRHEEEGHQQRAEVSEEDSHREQLMEGGTEVNEQERPQDETGPVREDLPSDTADGDNNAGSHEQPQQEEEAVDHPIQKLEEEVQTETHELESGGESGDQQLHPEQQETVSAGDDALDTHQLQQQQDSGDGGTPGSELHSDPEPKDLEGDQNQMQQTVGREAEGVEGQEQTQQQIEMVEGNEKHVGNSMQGIEDGAKASGEESQQQGTDDKPTDEPHVGDSLTYGAHTEVLPDAPDQKTPWSTQADQSQNAKEKLKASDSQMKGGSVGGDGDINGHEWKLCNATAGQDYIPCLDNEEALRHLHSTGRFEHRERHCPEEAPTCLVPLPKGYRWSIEWPKSRERIWYNNVPSTKLAAVKGHQNWVKVTGEYLSFPGGGTQFIHGALHYIDFLQKSVRNIAWGKHTRVVLDVGCGVASFGGYLFEKDVLTMSFAPKDEHEAQVQLALERGIPAISAVMGSQRLPFPSKVFDLVHCARCRVPWHAEGGSLLLELNRVLRPGGYFVWSATPVYQKLKEDMEIWKEMTSLTKSMCWDLITIRKDRLNSVGAAIYQKPISNECYENRRQQMPPMCMDDDDPDTAWYVPLQSCMHRVPTDASERGSQWPQEWPRRFHAPPYWLNSSEVGVYGKSAPDDFTADYEHWKRVVSKSYLNGLGIDWSKVRNVMDMRAVYGGFAAALKDLKVWVMNVVNVDSSDTLPIIYERGLFGIYHDWCESFSTYPRTYDLLHADQLFSNLKKRCSILPVVVEVDRILRPRGKLLLRDEPKIVSEIEGILRSLHWEVRLTFTKGREGILFAEKTDWRPEIFFGSS